MQDRPKNPTPRTKGRGVPSTPINQVLAVVPVADFPSALAWYERLLGRPADTIPMEGEEVAEWQVTQGGRIQLIRDAARAGTALLTLGVDDMDGQIAVLAERGLTLGAIQTTPGIMRIAVITDPAGNAITFGQQLSTAD